jgi:hypothetical protein
MATFCTLAKEADLATRVRPGPFCISHRQLTQTQRRNLRRIAENGRSAAPSQASV